MESDHSSDHSSYHSSDHLSDHSSYHSSIEIGPDDQTIWDQRRATSTELKSVNGTQLQAEFNYREYLSLRAALKVGNVDEFNDALKKYSDQPRVSLSDIINIQGPSGNTLFHIAAGIENFSVLGALLEVFPDKLLSVTYRGDTALHIAARAGRILSAELLLDFGSSVLMANDAGNTALHEAVKNSNCDLTRLLLSRGSIAVYPANKESKCPLYLAVETGNLDIFTLLMEAMKDNEVPWSRMQGMSPVHGAVVHQRLEMLKRMSRLKKAKELFNLRDTRGSTPLHLAAYVNYFDGVEFLADKFAWSAFEGDEEGYLPIHVACKMDHVKIIKELIQQWPDPEELLSLKEGQNILHVAAKYGRISTVEYILTDLNFKELINVNDKEGNTPLHVATLLGHHVIVVLLTRPIKAANLNLVNHKNMTALDIAIERKKVDAPIHEIRIERTLARAKAARSKEMAICGPKDLGPPVLPEPQHLDRLRNVANTRMLVATLVGTMTFAAGFSVPGGYNDSEPNAGIATLLNKPMYNVFVICNTVAMYYSIITIVKLLQAQKNSLDSVRFAVRSSTLSLLIALATMSVAFMAGVYATTSKCTWIAIVTLIIGIIAFIRVCRFYHGSVAAPWLAPRNRKSFNFLFGKYFIGFFVPISIYETGRRDERPARSRN